MNYSENNTESDIRRKPKKARRKPKTTMTFDKLRTIILMKERGVRIAEIAASTDLSTVAIYKLLDRFHKHCEDGGSINNFLGRPGRRPNEINPEDSLIQEIVIADNSLTQIGMKKVLLEEHGITISNASICRSLKRSRLTRKRIKRRSNINNQDSKTRRQLYSVSIRNFSDDNLFFLDESGFNLHTSISYGYSPIGLEAVQTVAKARGKNVSLLAMIGKSGFIHTELRLGAYKTNTYLAFLKEVIEGGMLKPGSKLVCDNVAFHKNREVLEYLASKGIPCFFLPPYTPQLNPIEEVFSALKSRLYRIRPIAMTTDELKINIESSIKSMKTDPNFSFNGFYSHMRVNLDKAFNGMDF